MVCFGFPVGVLSEKPSTVSHFYVKISADYVKYLYTTKDLNIFATCTYVHAPVRVQN